MRILHQEVKRVPEPLGRRDRVFGRVDFDALAATPEDVDASRPSSCAEVHRPHGFLAGEGADFGVVGGKRAVLEDRDG